MPSLCLALVVYGERMFEKPPDIIVPSLPLSSMMTLSGLVGVEAGVPMKNALWPFVR